MNTRVFPRSEGTDIHKAFAGLIGVLIIMGFWLRVRNLGELSLFVDEGVEALAIRGILETGLPQRNIEPVLWLDQGVAVPHIVVQFFALDVALGGAYLLNHAAGYTHYRLTNLVDPKQERNPLFFMTHLLLFSLHNGSYRLLTLPKSTTHFIL